MAFECKIRKDADGTAVLVAKGVLDEHAELPLVDAERIKLDLHGVSYLNSIGVRHWAQWGRDHRRAKEIVLTNCPVIFAKHFTMVNDFLAANMKAQSIFVPYYSEQTDERKDVLFTFGKEFDAKGVLTEPKVTDRDGNPMEMDIPPKSYFSFLR